MLRVFKKFCERQNKYFFCFQLSFIKINIIVKVILIFNVCIYVFSITLFKSIYGIYYFLDFYVSFVSVESILENYVKDSIFLDKNYNKVCE